MNGVIKNILIANKAGETLATHNVATVESGKGIVGDRYYLSIGTFSEKLDGTPDVEVTLIEQEEIDSFNKTTNQNYSGKDFRRNIVTKGVRLNELVGKLFNMGDVQLKGIRLCEPCAHLSTILGPEIMKHMVHKSGLRAQVVNSGTIRVSDEIHG